MSKKTGGKKEAGADEEDFAIDDEFKDMGLFDDSGLSTIPEGKPTGFGEEFDLNLYELEKMINKIDTTKGPLHTIRDPLMNEVRSLASKLLLLIDAEGGNQA